MQDHRSPEEKRAWITGASSGIGRAVALELVRRGWLIAASARTTSSLEALVAQGKGKIFSFPIDVTQAREVSELVSRIDESFGKCDLVILNAGTYEPMTIGAFDADKFRKIIDVNLLGIANCLDPILKLMIPRKEGQIAIVSSVAAYSGLPFAAAYGASKAGVLNMCESLRLECEQAGITLQVISPGFVKTPLTAKNKFSMPFLMDVEMAANRFVDGLFQPRFEITFPRRFSFILKLLRLMPYKLYFFLLRKGMGL